MSEPIAIGQSNGRKVFLSPKRRSVHMHVMGASGQGKSKFLEHCIQQDIAAGHGVCLIDPEGDLFERIVEFLALHRFDDGTRQIHLFDPTNGDWRFRFNPLFVHAGEKPLHRVGNVIEALSQVWGGEDSRGTPAIRTTLRAILYALVESGYTLAEAFYLTSTKDPYQLVQYLTRKLPSSIMREIWDGYQAAPDREHMTEFGGSRRRLSELLGDDEMREILATYTKPIDFKQCMDDGDIVLINLSPEAMGDDAGRAFGAMFVREMFYSAARRDPRQAEDKPFFAYIDECADFLTNDISKILARSRKRGLHVTLAHQWLEQLRERGDDIYHGVMGVQNKVIFGGVSDEDAAILADQLFRTEYDLEVPVQSLTKPGVAGYTRTWLNNWSHSDTFGTVDSVSESTTQSHGTAESSGTAGSVGTSSSVQQVYDEHGFPTATYTVTDGASTMTVDSIGQSVSSGWAQSDSASQSDVEMASDSYGASEAMMPILQDFVGGVHSLENVRHMAISRLRRIPPRNAVVKGFDTPTFEIRTFDVDDIAVHPDNVAAFKERVFTASPYVLPQAEVREQMLLEEKRLHHLAATTDQSEMFTEHPALLSTDEDDTGTY